MSAGPTDVRRDAVRRYRCTACGNLTRFTVTTSRRTTAFHHFTVGGDLTIEDVEVLEDRVEAVTCRWCGTGVGVVPLDEPPTADQIDASPS